MKGRALLAVIVSLVAACLAAEDVAVQEKYDAVAKAVAPSLVRVEYWLRFDDGEPPTGSGYRTRCPNCGRTVVERWGFAVRGRHTRDGCCTYCGAQIHGVGM